MARFNVVGVVQSVFSGFEPGSTASGSIQRIVGGATDGADAVEKLVKSGYLRDNGIYPKSYELKDLEKAFDKAM